MGGQFKTEAQILYAQNLHSLYLWPQYWVRKCAPFTIAGFEDSRPKTEGRNLTLEGAIFFQFQKIHNLAHDPQFFEP